MNALLELDCLLNFFYDPEGLVYQLRKHRLQTGIKFPVTKDDVFNYDKTVNLLKITQTKKKHQKYLNFYLSAFSPPKNLLRDQVSNTIPLFSDDKYEIFFWYGESVIDSFQMCPNTKTPSEIVGKSLILWNKFQEYHDLPWQVEIKIIDFGKDRQEFEKDLGLDNSTVFLQNKLEKIKNKINSLTGVDLPQGSLSLTQDITENAHGWDNKHFVLVNDYLNYLHNIFDRYESHSTCRSFEEVISKKVDPVDTYLQDLEVILKFEMDNYGK